MSAAPQVGSEQIKMVHEQMKTKGAKRAILVVEKTLLGHAQLLLDAKAEVRSMTVRVISSDDHGRGGGAARAVSYQHRFAITGRGGKGGTGDQTE